MLFGINDRLKKLRALYHEKRDTVRLRVMVSLLSSYLSQSANTGVNLMSRLLLARLIFPEDWGLFAQALLVMTLAGALRDLGIPLHLIRDEGKKFGGALLSEGIMGLLVMTIIWILAPFGAAWDPRLPLVIRVFSLILIPEGMAMVFKAWLERELLVNKALFCELGQVSVFALVSLLLGRLGYGIWSLVIGHMSGMLLFSLSLWFKAGREMPLKADIRQTLELARQSGFLFLNGLVGTSLGYIDNGILGSLLTSREVGYYFIAYTWAFLPGKLLFPAMYRIIYPTLARYRDDPERTFDIYRFGTIVLLAVELPIVALIFLNADIYVRILLGPQWLPSVPMLRIIVLGPAVFPFSRFGVTLLKVHRHDRLFFASSVVGLVSLVGFGWYLTLRFNAVGMAYANLLAFGSLIQLYGLIRIVGGKLWLLARDLFYLYAICLSVFLPLRGAIAVSSAAGALAISFTGVAIVWTVYYIIFGSRVRRMIGLGRYSAQTTME